MVIENLVAAVPPTGSAWFYRTSAAAELDLMLEFEGAERWAIEVKRTLSPSVTKGFHIACEDVEATQRFLVYPGSESYPLAKQTLAISLGDLLPLIRTRPQ